MLREQSRPQPHDEAVGRGGVDLHVCLSASAHGRPLRLYLVLIMSFVCDVRKVCTPWFAFTFFVWHFYICMTFG